MEMFMVVSNYQFKNSMNRRNFIARAFGALASLALAPKLIGSFRESIYTDLSERADFVAEFFVQKTHDWKYQNGYHVVGQIYDKRTSSCFALRTNRFFWKSNQYAFLRGAEEWAENKIQKRIDFLNGEMHDQR